MQTCVFKDSLLCVLALVGLGEFILKALPFGVAMIWIDLWTLDVYIKNKC